MYTKPLLRPNWSSLKIFHTERISRKWFHLNSIKSILVILAKPVFTSVRKTLSCCINISEVSPETPQSRSTTFPRHPKKESLRTNKDKANVTYETTGARSKKNSSFTRAKLHPAFWCSSKLLVNIRSVRIVILYLISEPHGEIRIITTTVIERKGLS